MPETSSHLSQSAAHTIAFPSLSLASSASASASTIHSSPRTTETTTSPTNNSELRSHSSISPQKETQTASVQNDISGTEMHVPETCANNTEGAASNGMCSNNGGGSTSTHDNSSGSSGSGEGSSSSVNSTAAPVSTSPQLHSEHIPAEQPHPMPIIVLSFIAEQNVPGRGESPIKRRTPVQSVYG